VVFSVITPAQKVQVYVGASYSASETNKVFYATAKVFVSQKDSAWVQLESNVKDNSIFIDTKGLLKIEKGNTYLLKVETLGKTVYAQTTLPTEGGYITHGECVIVSSNAGGSVNGGDFTSNLCALHLQLNLPNNNEYGCYLTAFSDRIDGIPFLSSSIYLENNFTILKGIRSFEINTVTVDPNLKRFLLAESVSSNMFDSDDVTEVLASYGGVYPAFSNIQNGVGLFGSFLINGKLISVTQKETPN